MWWGSQLWGGMGSGSTQHPGGAPEDSPTLPPSPATARGPCCPLVPVAQPSTMVDFWESRPMYPTRCGHLDHSLHGISVIIFTLLKCHTISLCLYLKANTFYKVTLLN